MTSSLYALNLSILYGFNENGADVRQRQATNVFANICYLIEIFRQHDVSIVVQQIAINLLQTTIQFLSTL